MANCGIKVNGVDILSMYNADPGYAHHGQLTSNNYASLNTSFRSSLSQFNIKTVVNTSEVAFVRSNLHKVFGNDPCGYPNIKYRGNPILIANMVDCPYIYLGGTVNNARNNQYVNRWGVYRNGTPGNYYINLYSNNVMVVRNSAGVNLHTVPNSHVIYLLLAGSGGGGGNSWSYAFGWDSGSGGGGGGTVGAYINLKFMGNLRVHIGRGGNGYASASSSHDGDDGENSYVYSYGKSREIITASGGKKGLSGNSVSNENVGGAGGGTSYETGYDGLLATYTSAGGAGGYKYRTNSQGNGRSAPTRTINWGTPFSSMGTANAGNRGIGTPYFIGKTGQSADRPGGGGGGCALGWSNTPTTTSNTQYPTKGTGNFGYGAGGAGGALCHGTNYGGQDGTNGGFIIFTV